MNPQGAGAPDVVDHLKTRFYGKYRGVVTEVEDAGRGRIKAKVPSVLGSQATGWCDPCVPYAGDKCGILFLPEVGTGVWIEFEGGDPSFPIWSGCYFRDDKIPEDAGPKKKVIRTAGGHQILFDDDAGSITIKDSNENEIVMDSSGVTIKRGSNKVLVSDSKVSVNDGAMEVV